jgi:hypothetical protein
LKKLYDVVWVAKGGDLPLATASSDPYGLDNGVSLDDFTDKRIDVTACIIKEGVGSSIRLKWPKHIINTLGIPEKGIINSSY